MEIIKRSELKEEQDYYRPIKDWLEQELKKEFNDFYLEITANKNFSNKLKGQISDYRNIIFYFLKKAAPDITGFIKKGSSTEFIVVEIKNNPIELDDIYQTRKYAELFDARYALLVSPEEIPEEIKRLSKTVYSLLSLPAYKHITIVRFNEKLENIEWFQDNPFVK